MIRKAKQRLFVNEGVNYFKERFSSRQGGADAYPKKIKRLDNTSGIVRRTLVVIACCVLGLVAMGVSLTRAEEQKKEIHSKAETSVLADVTAGGAETEFPFELPQKRRRIMGNTRQVQNTFTIEPFGFAVGTGTLEYERMIGQNLSLAVGYKFNRPRASAFYDGASAAEHTYWGYQGGIRFYPLEKFYAPRGLWVSSTVEYISDHYDQYNGTVFYTNVLAETGWSFMFKDNWGFIVSPFLGIGYSWGSGEPIINSRRNLKIAPFSGITGVLGVRVGVGF